MYKLKVVLGIIAVSVGAMGPFAYNAFAAYGDDELMDARPRITRYALVEATGTGEVEWVNADTRTSTKIGKPASSSVTPSGVVDDDCSRKFSGGVWVDDDQFSDDLFQEISVVMTAPGKRGTIPSHTYLRMKAGEVMLDNGDQCTTWVVRTHDTGDNKCRLDAYGDATKEFFWKYTASCPS